MASKDSKKTQRNKFLVALWLLLLLVLVIVFLVKKDDFVANLKSTNFFERITGSTPEFIQNYEPKEKKAETNGLLDVEVAPTPGKAETRPSGTFDLDDLKNNAKNFSESYDEQKNEDSAKTQSAALAENTPAEPTLAENPPETNAESTELIEEISEQIIVAPPSPAVVETPKPKGPTMNVKLFFVQVDSDGNVNRKNVTRAIPKNDSPLTSTIRALIEGPTSEDRGCMSLIPEGTRLLGASVHNGIAALNFSEEFEYNAIGAEGYRAQLMQIVFTATEFATVESVQFLIEGQHKDYIGSGEDVWMWIGSPYKRGQF